MPNLVNLDALIVRQDFEAQTDEPVGTLIPAIGIRTLESKDYFSVALRKPDFQRETSSWDAEKIAGFIKTFLAGEFIPAIIMWS